MPPDMVPGELSTVFARLSGMLLADQDATAAVQELAFAARQMISSAAGAGVSLFDDDGDRTTTASTDTRVEAADALQYHLGQGPCLSAWATRSPQLVQDTTVDTRWGPWQAAAAESGIRSALSTPLLHESRALGAMKVYATRPDAFGEAEEQLLGRLANAAATLLGAAQPLESPTRLSAVMKAALESRDTVALAAGILMNRDRLDAAAARSALLQMARTRGRRVHEIATEIVQTQQSTPRRSAR